MFPDNLKLSGNELVRNLHMARRIIIITHALQFLRLSESLVVA